MKLSKIFSGLLLAAAGSVQASSPPPAITGPVYEYRYNSGNYTVSWPSSPGATYYTLWEKTNGGLWYNAKCGIEFGSSVTESCKINNSTSYGISGNSSAHYDYVVHACNSHGCNGRIISKIDVVLNTPAPGVTASFSPSAADYGGSATLNWSASNADYCTVDGSTQSTAGSQTYHGITSYTAKNVTCTQKWDNGDLTASATAAVGVKPPATPTARRDFTDDDGHYDIAWEGVSQATHYRLWEKGADNLWHNVPCGEYVLGNSLPYGCNIFPSDAVNNQFTQQITGKTEGQYGYVVHACNGNGCADKLINSVNVNFDKQTPQITVNWSANPAAYGSYSTLSWNAQHADYCTIAGEDGRFNPVDSKAFHVNNDTTKHITCTNTWDNGAGQAQASLQTTVGSLPSTPVIQTANFTDENGHFMVNWHQPHHASHYQLYERFNDGERKLLTSGQHYSNTSYKIENRVSGEYSYIVEACNPHGCIERTAANVTVDTSLQATPEINVAVKVYWSFPVGASESQPTLNWSSSGAHVCKIDGDSVGLSGSKPYSLPNGDDFTKQVVCTDNTTQQSKIGQATVNKKSRLFASCLDNTNNCSAALNNVLTKIQTQDIKYPVIELGAGMTYCVASPLVFNGAKEITLNGNNAVVDQCKLFGLEDWEIHDDSVRFESKVLFEPPFSFNGQDKVVVNNLKANFKPAVMADEWRSQWMSAEHSTIGFDTGGLDSNTKKARFRGERNDAFMVFNAVKNVELTTLEINDFLRGLLLNTPKSYNVSNVTFDGIMDELHDMVQFNKHYDQKIVDPALSSKQINVPFDYITFRDEDDIVESTYPEPKPEDFRDKDGNLDNDAYLKAHTLWRINPIRHKLAARTGTWESFDYYDSYRKTEKTLVEKECPRYGANSGNFSFARCQTGVNWMVGVNVIGNSSTTECKDNASDCTRLVRNVISTNSGAAVSVGNTHRYIDVANVYCNAKPSGVNDAVVADANNVAWDNCVYLSGAYSGKVHNVWAFNQQSVIVKVRGAKHQVSRVRGDGTRTAVLMENQNHDAVADISDSGNIDGIRIDDVNVTNVRGAGIRAKRHVSENGGIGTITLVGDHHLQLTKNSIIIATVLNLIRYLQIDDVPGGCNGGPNIEAESLTVNGVSKAQIVENSDDYICY